MRAKTDKFRGVLEEAVRHRMEVLRNESETLANDMDALVLRLSSQGHIADLLDIRSARWYRAAAQLDVLREICNSFCDVFEITIDPIKMPEDPE